MYKISMCKANSCGPQGWRSSSELIMRIFLKKKNFVTKEEMRRKGGEGKFRNKVSVSYFLFVFLGVLFRLSREMVHDNDISKHSI